MTKQEFLEIKDLGINEGLRKALAFCETYGLYDFSNDYIEDYKLDDYIRGCDFKDLYFKLKDIRNINADYFYIDGYDNFRNVEQSDIDCMVDDILRDYEHLFEDDFDEWEEEEE